MALFTSIGLSSRPSQTAKKPKRYNFHNDWEELFFFMQINGKCVCLICNSSVALAKKSNVERHYRTVHKNFDDNFHLGSELRNEKVRQLKNQLLNQYCTLMNTSNTKENASGMDVNVGEEAQLEISGTERSGSADFSSPNKRRKLQQRLSTVKNSVNDLINSPTTSHTNQSEDNEFDIFGLYVSTCLRKLPLPRAFRLQEKINSLIAEERISYAFQNTPFSNGMTAKDHRPDNDDMNSRSISPSVSSHYESIAGRNENFNENSHLEEQHNVKTEVFQIECEPEISF